MTLLCDSREHYLDTYYNSHWIAENIGCLQPWQDKLSALELTNSIESGYEIFCDNICIRIQDSEYLSCIG